MKIPKRQLVVRALIIHAPPYGNQTCLTGSAAWVVPVIFVYDSLCLIVTQPH